MSITPVSRRSRRSDKAAAEVDRELLRLVALAVRSITAIAFVVVVPAWLTAAITMPLVLGAACAVAREPGLLQTAFSAVRGLVGPPE